MAFPTKGTRKITVNNQRYFWCAKGTDWDITLSVMADTKTGQILNTGFSYSHDQKPLGNGCHSLDNQFVVTPYTVRQVILQGIKEGWTPLIRAKPHYISDVESKIDLRLDLNKENRIKEAVRGSSTQQVPLR